MQDVLHQRCVPWGASSGLEGIPEGGSFRQRRSRRRSCVEPARFVGFVGFVGLRVQGRGLGLGLRD